MLVQYAPRVQKHPCKVVHHLLNNVRCSPLAALSLQPQIQCRT